MNSPCVAYTASSRLPPSFQLAKGNKGIFMSWYSTLLLCSTILLITSCGGSSSGSHTNPNSSSTSSGGNIPQEVSIELFFERLDSGTFNNIEVTVSLNVNGEAVRSAADEISVALDSGSSSAISDQGSGLYQFVITPNRTGEHSITVNYNEHSITRTALVLGYVDDDWGQPMSVSGLVNTEGYEDGVTITPDGEYLFVQYGPTYFSGLILFGLPRNIGGCGGHRLEHPIGTPNRCTHPWVDDLIGPTAEPERPGFFDGRISAGSWLHNANSRNIGIEQAPIFVPSTMFYGFKRQSDGTFTAPFYLSFEDENDAITSPFGLSFMLNPDNTAQAIFAFNDPSDPHMVDFDNNGSDDAESFIDVYTSEIIFGENNNLGIFVPQNNEPGTLPARANFFPSSVVNFGQTGLDGLAGTQGNPHLYSTNGIVESIWTDDEYDQGGDRDQISVYHLDSGTLNSGTWTKIELPSPVNEPSPSVEFQPFFTGSELIFTHSSEGAYPEIWQSDFSGEHNVTSLGSSSSWTPRTRILAGDSVTAVGNAIAVGEPTVAVRDGETYLYFVYGYVRATGDPSGLPDINMQAGYIKKRNH